jgi:hypothetical protein
MEVYDVYHDESKHCGYWHGFLFVPRSQRSVLLEVLNKSRDRLNYQSKVHFSKVPKSGRQTNGRVSIVKSWISIGVASLQQQKNQKFPAQYSLGVLRKNAIELGQLENLIGAKFVLFRERDNHEKCYFDKDPLRNVETTLRMGLKSGMHSLFPVGQAIQIGNVYLDGEEHYYGEYGRTVDVTNIIDRLSIELRNHIKFLPESKIVAEQSDHEKVDNEHEKEHCHLLQLCDVLIGGVRIHCVETLENDIRIAVSYPCKKLLEYDTGNRARMSESRYFNGFSFGEAWIEDGSWNFGRIQTTEEKNRPETGKLF